MRLKTVGALRHILTPPECAARLSKPTRPEGLRLSNPHLMHLDPLTLTLRHVEKVGVPHLRPPALVDLIRELSAVADIKYLSLFIYLFIFIYTRIYKNSLIKQKRLIKPGEIL